MGALLGWSARRTEAELDAYEGAVRQGLRFRTEESPPPVAQPSRKPGMMGAVREGEGDA
jgi:hypothetical protein